MLYCLTIVGIVLLGQSPTDQADIALNNLCSDVCAKDIETRLNVQSRIVNAHLNSRKLSRKMIQIIQADKNDINDESYGTPRQIALFVMAHHVDLRSEPEVIKTFINHIDVRFAEKFVVRELLSKDRDFPSLRGLLLIGERATVPVLEKIKGTDERRIHDLLAFWFYKYYGQRVAIRYFNDLLDENPKMPIVERKRLVHVLELLEKPGW